MLFTFFRFRFKGETVKDRHDDWFKELQNNVVFGALDDNIDGKLTAAEFRNDPRFKSVVQFLPMVDSDKDGALSKPEMAKAMQMMQQMRAKGAAPAAPADGQGRSRHGRRLDRPEAVRLRDNPDIRPRRATGGAVGSYGLSGGPMADPLEVRVGGRGGGAGGRISHARDGPGSGAARDDAPPGRWPHH